MLTKIAAVQMASGPQIKANLMEATRLIREAAKKGAQMVVLPESFALMAMHESENIDLAENYGKGPIQETMRQCAIDNKVWIVAGSVPLKLDDSEKVSASSLMFNDKGEIVARYNKIHLFDVDINSDDNKTKEHYRESDTFEYGKDIVVVDTPFGKIGMAICYDLRFPMLFREMVKQGAEIFLIPSAFAKSTGKIHWEPLIKARAIENQCYVIAPAQGGYHVNGRHTYGNSMAVDYLGQVHGLRLKGSGIITINIDLKAQKKLRESFPVLKHTKLI
ncbi:carbon-nitrogen hydrolase family protein [Cocleimonas sp. KMM 6892]|uniref:carbon-nitrogen hydrolase family protein n=1 Tax=unclassified Cocleimonas TaxID=2639732 RepID=UPI002DBA9457|nr:MULTISPECIES: carbon-nitrogen hydrolase family protein [unclassified Cocleimonas]MEB8433981.1 carbon-nitrogen hydrolase family protein [Cocleimonas sp. KMM 6892]MEC4716792.1 carbon-nitrogen hydrolase family protein [Cocleimonas sp. KMM 6895]MEC4746053.1 carbon-nitrogen hydrolase family protein [Cocleimonas sp. KMM 6896]